MLLPLVEVQVGPVIEARAVELAVLVVVVFTEVVHVRVFENLISVLSRAKKLALAYASIPNPAEKVVSVPRP